MKFPTYRPRRPVAWLAFLALAALMPYYAQAQIINLAEYFFDTDPGQGNGTSILPCDGVFDEAQEEFCPNVICNLPGGKHTFFLRLRDSENRWFTRRQTFHVVASNIAQAEYYFDTDPGLGNGTAIPACDGSFDELIERICADAICDLPAGEHTLFLRIQDSDGRWFTRRHAFQLAASRIEYAEYYIDSDPGQGNGIQVQACDGSFDQSLERLCKEDMLPPDIPFGRHALYLRLRDSDNRWQQKRLDFNVSSSNPQFPAILTAAEYFIDTDHGEGSETPLPPGDGAFDEPSEFLKLVDGQSNSFSLGSHTLFVRAKNSHDVWGATRRLSFRVVEQNGERYITGAEFYIDIDSGLGQGDSLYALDYPFNQPTEVAYRDSIRTDTLDYGNHSVYVRFRDNVMDSTGFIGWGLSANGILRVMPSGPTGIAGVVREHYSSTPLDSVIVSALQNGTTIKQDTSDSSGLYFLSDLTAGAYDVIGSRDGYIPDTVLGVNVNWNESTFVDLDLPQRIPNPVLSLSSAPFFGDSTSFFPLSGNEGTQFEFRITYQDSAGIWPQIGYPRILIDRFGNGSIVDTVAMAKANADSLMHLGADFNYFAALPSGGRSRIKFEALNGLGLSTSYPQNGWLSGPEVFGPNSTDLYVYADDINYSGFPARPNPGEEVTIYARVHNNSNLAHQGVAVNLYLDDDLVQTFTVDLPAGGSLDESGFADVSFNTVFNQIAFYDIRVTVDPDNQIAEWNEANNTAHRALFVGDYELPCGIAINAYPLGSHYPLSTVTGGGRASYEENGVFRGYLAGTPVYVTVTDADVRPETVYVNDYGYFCYSFRAPVLVGQYHVQITITDFTLTGTVIVPFEVIPVPDIRIPPCCPPIHWDGEPCYWCIPSPKADLAIIFYISGFPFNICGRDVTMSAPIVYNFGSVASGACRARLRHDSEDILVCDVPPLAPGQFFVLPLDNNTVHEDTPGYHSILGIVDFENQVEEYNKLNNSLLEPYYVWCCPGDLHPRDLTLNGVPYPNRPTGISAQVENLGAIAIPGYDLLVTDSCWSGIDEIARFSGLSLPGYGVSQWYTISQSYAFADTGWHKIKVVADPDSVIAECREDNNIYSRWIYIGLPKPDLWTRYEDITVDNPNAAIGETVHFQGLIHNTGNATASNFNVRFFLDHQDYTTSPDVFVTEIVNGASQLVPHPTAWTVGGSQCPITVFADYGNLVREYYENNNCDSVPVPYDFYPVYSSICGGAAPQFFSTCNPAISEPVTIALTAKNAGILNYNGQLQFNIYDSLSGASSRELIGSSYVSGPYLHHKGNLVTGSYVHQFTEYGTHYVTVKINPNEIVPECNFDNDSTIYPITITPPRPDLVIRSEWILPSDLNPQLGDTFCIENVDVYNFGDAPAYNVEILFQEDDEQLGAIVVIPEIPNTGNNYRPVHPTECVVVDTCQPNMHNFKACADPFDRIPELVEDNNCGTKSIIFCEAPDLYVKNVYLNPECERSGDSVNIVAVIADSGGAPGSAFVDFCYLDHPELGWPDTISIDSTYIQNVGPGIDTAVTSINWIVPGDSCRILIKILHVYPFDYNSDNNTASYLFRCGGLCDYIPGDINSNGQANGIDVVYGVNYFKGGPYPPYSCDCPQHGVLYAAGDVNGSCTFNGIDITYFVSYLKGGAALRSCLDCPPGGLLVPPVRGVEPTPAVEPVLTPILKIKHKTGSFE